MIDNLEDLYLTLATQEGVVKDFRILAQVFESYDIDINTFTKMVENKESLKNLENEIESKLRSIKNRNYHTISTKENLEYLLEENYNNEGRYIVYEPLNPHSGRYLKKGDILFYHRIGEFSSLREGLNKRGIYAVGIAISDSLKIHDKFKDRQEYKNYGVLVYFPTLLKTHLSVKDIQMHPKTIATTPYNGNRNDSLQRISEKEQYKTILSLILERNPKIKHLYDFLNIEVEQEFLAEEVWNYFTENMISSTETDGEISKENFKAFLETQDLRKKTVQNYISGLNSLEREWNNKNKDNPISIWKDSAININFKEVIKDKSIEDFDNRQNRTISSALKYYLNYLSSISPQDSAIRGRNVMFFGAPGTGKSFSIQTYIKNNGLEEYSDDIDHPNVFRSTLHPEFSYYDFVGQIMPIVKENSDNTNSITYDYSPKIFVNALLKALRSRETPVFLILEELSRANVASVFGDLFQLLDRDENGRSTYMIDNEIIKNYLNSKEIKINKIYIPENLFIIGTANTNDQNVFVMDTAFKRRFEFIYKSISDIKREENGEPLNNFQFEFLDNEGEKLKFSWINLINVLNKFIVDGDEKGGLALSEDKQIGQFFIQFDSSDMEYNYDQFYGKFLQYLWYDVIKASFSTNNILNEDINSFDNLYNKATSKKNIFNDNIIKALNTND